MRNANVTVRDIARKANVSISTVSLALNNKPNISDEMKKRVLEAASELGYQYTVDKLEGNARKAFIMLFPAWVEQAKNKTYNGYLDGVHKAAKERGIRISYLANCIESMGDIFLEVLERELEYARGIIFAGMRKGCPVFNFVLKRAIPCVCLNRRFKTESVGTVSVDYRDTSKKLISLLINKGYREIFFTMNDPDMFSYTQERYRGYCDALAEHGMPVMSGKVICGTEEKQIHHLVSLLDESASQRVAVFADGDALAHSIILGLKQLGKRVPEDILVVGYDALDFEGGPFFPSVDFSADLVGQLAVDMLDKMLEVRTLTKAEYLIDGKIVGAQYIPELNE